MCCYENWGTECKVKARFGKRETAVFWKMLFGDGWSEWYHYQYKPGVNVANDTKGRYRTGRPRGLHVFLDKQKTEDFFIALPVTCHRDDLIRAGQDDGCKDQAVFRRLTICKKDWKAAGFQVRTKP